MDIGGLRRNTKTSSGSKPGEICRSVTKLRTRRLTSTSSTIANAI